MERFYASKLRITSWLFQQIHLCFILRKISPEIPSGLKEKYAKVENSMGILEKISKKNHFLGFFSKMNQKIFADQISPGVKRKVKIPWKSFFFNPVSKIPPNFPTFEFSSREGGGGGNKSEKHPLFRNNFNHIE